MFSSTILISSDQKYRDVDVVCQGSNVTAMFKLRI